jgi:hypothetical protein
MPVDEVQRGMQATGRSVFQGTTISDFRLEIMGVVQNFNLGEDIILARVLDGPVVERKSGVIAGMSGSPIYVQGRLIGALAFSWPFTVEPICGITTINSMLRAWDKQAGAAPVKTAQLPHAGVLLDGHLVTGAQIATAPTAAFVDDHTISLRPTAPLLFCSGFSPDMLKLMGKFMAPWGITPMAGPGTMRDPVETKLEPGSSLGVQLISGDVDMTGIGTVTYVDQGRLLAFGHPMLKLGAVDFPITTAWIHDIIPSLEHSIKMGSAMKTAGALNQDTPWSLGATIGGEPAPLVPVTVRVTDETCHMTHEYHFSCIQQEALTPLLVMMGASSAIEAGFSAGALGMVTSTFTLEGTAGAKVSRSNTSYFEGSPLQDLSREILEGVAMFRYNLYQPQGVKSVQIDASFRSTDETAMIERVYAEQAIAKAGEPLAVHVVVRPWGGQPLDKRILLDLPVDLPATNLEIGVCGGSLAPALRGHLGVLTPDYDTLEGMLHQWEKTEDNTQLLVMAAGAVAGMSVGGVRLPNLPQSVQALLTATVPLNLSEGFQEISVKEKLPWALYGGALLTVPVENRRGERPAAAATTPGKKPEGAAAPAKAESPATPPSEKPSMVWTAKPTAQSELELPAYPPPSLRWAAAGLRPDIAARLRGASPQQADGPEDQAGAGGKDTTVTPATPAPDATQTEEKPKKPDETAKPETSKPDEEKRTAEEGVGKVLRQPTEWSQSTQDDFKEGETHGTGIGSEGGVLLVPTFQRQAGLPDKTLLAATCAPDGTLYVSTDGGRLYRVKGDRPEQVCATGEFALTALAARPDGTILAGTTAPGRILQITPQGQSKLLCELPVTYIWSLLLAPDGTLYAGTGPEGVLYKISPEGKCTPLAKLPVNHIMALAWRGTDLVAGTAQEGGVYLVRADGQVQALQGTGDNDVTSVVVDAAGDLYAGTAPEGKVLRISPSGHATTVWEDTSTPVYALLPTAEGVLIGTASDGQVLLARSAEKTATVLTDSPVDFISKLVTAPNGQAYLLGNSPGMILGGTLTGAREGTYTSTVLDAERLAQWGKVTWDATLPDKTTLEVQCRSGNTADPVDGTWSAWSRPCANGGPAEVPASRYLQYRLHFSAPSAPAAAEVKRLTITYLPDNQRPKLTAKAPDPGSAVHGKVKLTWGTSDDDEDALSTYVYARSGAAEWKKLAGPLTATDYEWDTSELAGGRYQVRLVTDDRRSNPVGWLAQEALISDLLVDNASPTMLLKIAGADLKTGDLSGTALDEGSGVVSVAWKQAEDDNGEEAVWTAAAPGGLLFGAPLVSFTIARAQLPADAKAIIVRAIDAAGNYCDLQIDLATGEVTTPPEKPAKDETKAAG